MNGERGEARAELAGAERKLCLTLGALAEIETALGIEVLEALADRMRRLSAKDLMAVLTAQAGAIEAAGAGSGVTVNVTVDGGPQALLRSESQIARMLARAAAQ